MDTTRKTGFVVLSLGIFFGLAVLGYLLGKAALDVKQLERSVTVKGLSEQEHPADVVIWPVVFVLADNDLDKVYVRLKQQTAWVRELLERQGIASADITVQTPNIVDKSAQQYGGDERAPFRYVARQTVVVYSRDVDTVRKAMTFLPSLGQKGIAFETNNYDLQPQYLFTRLNEVKPAMVEEATIKAREVAQKFAEDSDSQLGKIKRASQGSFSISERDSAHPYIKRVRVVSTVEYYLSD
ncbi:MAG: hypothetical protein CSA53_00690 [Gammaproteobacteria bacterium]|nr:MAG: hypothetical protein CSA53_00690 [Gammaproteobacteria bacterium]